MKCPFCATPDTKVIDSRVNQQGDITRRRRECIRCESRFTTYERVEEILPAVIKKDGRVEAFDRSKVEDGLRKATQKRPVSSEQIEAIVRRTEKSLQGLGLKEIPSRKIGELLISELHAIDKVAYVRFASVYREFKDVDDFVSELREKDRRQNRQKDDESLLFPFVKEPPTV